MVDKDKKRGPGRPREFDKDDVLDKVIEVFWELGYERADTETLCRRTGLTKPSLYNTFGSKEELFVAAIKRYRLGFANSSFEALTSASTPSEGLRDYFLHLAEHVAGDGHPTGCLLMSVAMPLTERLPKVAAALADLPEKSLAQMTSYFETQKESGALPKSFDSFAAITLFEDLVTAVTMQGRFGVPLKNLQDKAVRNSRLVLLEGRRSEVQTGSI